MPEWLTIEVFDAEYSASTWRRAHESDLTEAAMTHGASEVNWHATHWGVVLELAFAWQLRSERGSFWRFVIALAGFVTGAFVLMRPAAGMLVLAFWLGTMVIIRGAMQLMLSWELRGTHFWGWHFFDGVVSIAAGVFIIYAWPVGTVAFLGVWVGISLMMNGLNRFAMAVMLKRLLPPSSKGRPYTPLHA